MYCQTVSLDKVFRDRTLCKFCILVIVLSNVLRTFTHINRILCVVAELKVVLKANYTWTQISRMRRSLEQLKQFKVNFQNSKNITKCQSQFKFTRDG